MKLARLGQRGLRGGAVGAGFGMVLTHLCELGFPRGELLFSLGEQRGSCRRRGLPS